MTEILSSKFEMINAKFAICNEFIPLSAIISNLVFEHYLNAYKKND